jgi:hypothetical protein
MFMVFNFRKLKDENTHGNIPLSFRKPRAKHYIVQGNIPRILEACHFDGTLFKIHMK